MATVCVNEAYFSSPTAGFSVVDGYDTSRSGNLQGSSIKNRLVLNAKTANALYKDDCNDVRVNALLGLNLIRAF